MTNDTYDDGSAPGYVHAVLSNVTNHAPAHLSRVLNKAMDAVLDTLDGIVRNAAHPTTRSVSIQEMTITEASLDLDHLPVDNHQNLNRGGEPELTTLPNLETDHDSLTPEADASDEIPQPAVSRYHGHDGTPHTCSKLMHEKLALLIVGILFFVITPGLILAFITKQPEWGIAFSGLLATVASMCIGVRFPMSTGEGEGSAELRTGDLLA